MKCWRRHFLAVEAALSVVLTAAFFGWVQFAGGYQIITDILGSRPGQIYGVLAAIFAGLLGFIITVVSIILGYTRDGRLEILRNSDHYVDLWRTFTSAIRALGLATVVSLIGLIGERENVPPLRPVLSKTSSQLSLIPCQSDPGMQIIHCRLTCPKGRGQVAKLMKRLIGLVT